MATDGKMFEFVLSTVPKLPDLFPTVPLAPSLHLGGSLNPHPWLPRQGCVSPAKEPQMSPAANGQ